MMRYFFYRVGSRITSLRRLDLSKGIADRWSDGKWIDSGRTIDAISGYASDSDDFEEISEKKANDYIKLHRWSKTRKKNANKTRQKLIY